MNKGRNCYPKRPPKVVKERKWNMLCRGAWQGITHVVTAVWTLDSNLSKNGDALVCGNKEIKWAVMGIFIFYTTKSLHGLPCWLRQWRLCLQCRRPGLIPGSGRSPGEENPLQYSYLGNPMDRGVWWATVLGLAKSQTWLSHTHTHTSLCNQEVALFMNVLKENRSKCHKNPLKDLKVFANEKREWGLKGVEYGQIFFTPNLIVSLLY